MLRAALVLAWLLALPLRPALAEPLDPTPPFVIELQNAIRNDDKDWLADHLHLPVNYFGKTKEVIGSKDWFLKHYATVIGPELKAEAGPRDVLQKLSGRYGGRRRPQYLARRFRRRRRRHPCPLRDHHHQQQRLVPGDTQMSAERTPGFNTLAIHAGAHPDPATGARATPIYQTTSYVFENVDHAAALFNLETFGNIYTRIMNPTQAVLEERVAALEGGTAALAVASGHAAQALVFHVLLDPGDEFVAARQLYGGSINQFTQSFKKFNWNVRFADTDNAESFRAALSPKTKAIFVESIANPGGIITDIAAISAVAKEAGVPLSVDNTLATPYLVR